MIACKYDCGHCLSHDEERRNRAIYRQTLARIGVSEDDLKDLTFTQAFVRIVTPLLDRIEALGG